MSLIIVVMIFLYQPSLTQYLYCSGVITNKFRRVSLNCCTLMVWHTKLTITFLGWHSSWCGPSSLISCWMPGGGHGWARSECLPRQQASWLRVLPIHREVEVVWSNPNKFHCAHGQKKKKKIVNLSDIEKCIYITVKGRIYVEKIRQ